MDKSQKEEVNFIDPENELKAVLKKLDEFADQSKAQKIHWHKNVGLIRCFLSNDFRIGMLEKHRVTQQQLFNAIDWIKKNYFLIEKYQQGSDEGLKMLANYALETIKKYNTVLDEEEAPAKDWKEKIIRFITEQAGLKDEELIQNKIEIPKPVVHQRDETVTKPTSRLALKAGRNVTVAQVETPGSRKVASIAWPLQKIPLSDGKPSIHEINAFQVKVYSLITEHGLSLDSIREALQVIKHAPIESQINKNESEERTEASIISLRQTLSFLPGEVIELSGAFERINPLVVHSIPLLETFRLSSTSTQTGHPDPRQHTGWALPHSLIPSFPLRPHQLPLLQPIYRRKNDAAVALLPKGRLNNRARQLYALKRKAFEIAREEILKLHVQLTQAIISAAPTSHLSEAAELVLARFYEAAATQFQLIDFLAETHQKLNEALIVIPNEKLKSAYLDRSNPLLQVEDTDVKLLEAEKILVEEISLGLQNLQNEKSDSMKPAEIASIDFMCAMGALLADSVKIILLQQYSEIIGFKPPMLDDFEQKLQACVHKHLIDFLDELEGEEDLEAESILLTIINRIHDNIEKEIELFNAKTFDNVDSDTADLVHELEAYYHARYYARTSRGR